MKKTILVLALSPLFSHADLAPLDEDTMQSISGKGIEIDARIDFAQDTTYNYGDDWSNSLTSSRDDNWISYRRILVDSQGRNLSDNDTDGDGYINEIGGGNVLKKDVHNGYNVTYKDEREDGGDYFIRKPYYVILGEISGGISFAGLQLDLVSDFGANKNKAALKWTLPDKIEFHDFTIDGLYVSEDEYIDKPGYHPEGHANAGQFYGDNKILGARLDGPIYMPSATSAYVFITSD